MLLINMPIIMYRGLDDKFVNMFRSHLRIFVSSMPEQKILQLSHRGPMLKRTARLTYVPSVLCSLLRSPRVIVLGQPSFNAAVVIGGCLAGTLVVLVRIGIGLQ